MPIMTEAKNKEKRFYNTLKEVFIGAKVEGESGYVNLMAIKSRYYEKGVFPRLQEDIETALKDFPHFREELFDKLYTFFHRYFSESGSIYYRYTPLHQNIYEKVYTDDKDVMLFWKTHMLYYVKTDRLFKSLGVELDGVKFFFDVSSLEHKRANEKRETIYGFKEKKENGTLVFNVSYSEKGRKTKIDEILKELKKNGQGLGEELLEQAFRVFERQSEVDYFINKNAKAFLQEQFNLWLYQYVFSGESQWTETRIRQLQAMKDIAYKIIDFIGQFEDELAKIWNKPKFVRNSNYVITLDRIVSACHSDPERSEGEESLKLIEKILSHKNFNEQVKEWKELRIVDNNFKKTKVIETDLTGRHLSDEFKHLPVDTKYFKDLELEILVLFENLDQALDGWLVKSENYQALNTILPKFKEKVQTIYIDPPFNKEQDADYFYSVKYKDASWVTILENRLRLARDILATTGTIYVKCDYNGNMYVRLLINEIFGQERFLSEIIWKRFTGTKSQFKSFSLVTDTIYAFAKSGDWVYEQQFVPYEEKYLRWFKHEDKRGKYLIRNFYSPGDGLPRKFFGKLIAPPKGHHWRMSQEKIDEYIKEERIVLDEKGFPKLKNYIHEMGGRPLDNLIDEIHVVQGVSNEYYDFPTQNPEKLLLEGDLDIKLTRANRSIVKLLTKYYAIRDNKAPYQQFVNRMGFWMATGSGKTLVLVKLLQILHLLIRRGEIPPHDLLVLTHRDDLIEQLKRHVSEFNSMRSDLFIKLRELKEYAEAKRENPTLFKDRELSVFYYRSDNLSDEQKEKIIDFRNYDNNGRWYIFLDEAHKGDKEDSKRQHIYSILSRNGFLFNFSATFTDRRDLLTTVSDFNLSKFIKAGYGKHISILNQEIRAFRDDEDYNNEEKQKVVLKSLIMLAYVQKAYETIRKHRANLYHRPLFLTLVNSVNIEDADLKLFFRELERIGKGDITEGNLESAVEELWEELKDEPELMFEGDRLKVNEQSLKCLKLEDMLKYVYNSGTSGEIEILVRPSNRQELAFKLKTSDKPFALIKIGDISGWLKGELEGYEVNEKFDDESYFESNHKKIRVKNITNHYYLPVILSEDEKVDYISHIIKTKSEVDFVNKLEEYLNRDNKFKEFDWWMFSKLDGSLDEVYIPYYNPDINDISPFKPDFIFWLQKGENYFIVFIDPKGTKHTDYEHKVDGYKRIFVQEGSRRKILDHEGLKVEVLTFLHTDDRNKLSEGYREYWFDSIDNMLGHILTGLPMELTFSNR